MKRDPWTDPDPQPGDFDEFLENLDPSCVTVHPGNPNVKVTILEDDDVEGYLRRRDARRETPAPPRSP